MNSVESSSWITIVTMLWQIMLYQIKVVTIPCVFGRCPVEWTRITWRNGYLTFLSDWVQIASISFRKLWTILVRYLVHLLIAFGKTGSCQDKFSYNAKKYKSDYNPIEIWTGYSIQIYDNQYWSSWIGTLYRQYTMIVIVIIKTFLQYLGILSHESQYIDQIDDSF